MSGSEGIVSSHVTVEVLDKQQTAKEDWSNEGPLQPSKVHAPSHSQASKVGMATTELERENVTWQTGIAYVVRYNCNFVPRLSSKPGIEATEVDIWVIIINAELSLGTCSQA